MSCVFCFFITQVEDSIQSFSPLLRAILVKPWTSGMMSGCQ